MPSKHSTRGGIADEVDGIEYETFDGTGFADGYGVRTREREFTKSELITIYEHLCAGFFVERASLDTTRKPAVRDALRRLMDEQEYRGFGEDRRDGNPPRARELLTVLTGVRDAKENLRWEGEDV